MKVNRILKSDVKQFYNRLREQRNLKPATVDSVHTVLHQVLQVAVDNRFIIKNPSDNAMTEFKRGHYTKGEKKHALTVEQEKLLLDFLKEDATYGHWYPVVAVMLGTGMRVGELTGLRWCDLDMDGRSAPVAILNSNMGGKAH
ncbi:MAG: tyrosine-type recombinase/integrase [Parasporobacterium sp.]|nr:tyrosine-type recombinase/integrase [Parasporobacterium sp.]